MIPNSWQVMVDPRFAQEVPQQNFRLIQQSGAKFFPMHFQTKGVPRPFEESQRLQWSSQNNLESAQPDLARKLQYVGETGVLIFHDCRAYVLIPNPSLSTLERSLWWISWPCSTIKKNSSWRWGGVGGRKSCWNPDSWMATWKLGALKNELVKIWVRYLFPQGSCRACKRAGKVRKVPWLLPRLACYLFICYVLFAIYIALNIWYSRYIYIPIRSASYNSRRFPKRQKFPTFWTFFADADVFRRFPFWAISEPHVHLGIICVNQLSKQNNLPWKTAFQTSLVLIKKVLTELLVDRSFLHRPMHYGHFGSEDNWANSWCGWCIGKPKRYQTSEV